MCVCIKIVRLETNGLAQCTALRLRMLASDALTANVVDFRLVKALFEGAKDLDGTMIVPSMMEKHAEDLLVELAFGQAPLSGTLARFWVKLGVANPVLDRTPNEYVDIPVLY